jgi:hypothetical protein
MQEQEQRHEQGKCKSNGKSEAGKATADSRKPMAGGGRTGYEL